MMLRYHPERYRATRAFSKNVVNYYKNHVNDGCATERDLRDIQNMVLQEYQRSVAKLPFELRPSNTRVAAKEISYAMHYGHFASSGRNIFHFEQDMIESFKHTDIDQVPASAISFPYTSFYMSFGKQEDLNLWNEGYYVDGAYISASPGLPLQIMLSTIRDDVNYKDDTNWITNPDRYYYLSLDLSDGKKLISNIMEESLKEEIEVKDLTQLPDHSGVYEVDGKKIYAIDVKKESSTQEVAEVKHGFNVFQEAMKLVINGICYITTYLDDVEERWPVEAPVHLVEKLKKPATKKDFQKAKADLLASGYSKVNYCGTKFIKENVTLIPSGGGEKSAHWRRGHWRNQAFGDAHQQRRLVWIMPMIIRKDRSMPEQGHIYSM